MSEQPFAGALEPGAKLDKYEVREQVAAGGMAIVYKAYDPSLDRHVAIKQIAPHLARDERFVERFRAEAQTLARISGTQANIVNVYELIERDGRFYLVMEYVEGTTLRTLMDRGTVPLQTGLGVLLATALGLKAMHAGGIVHRDLTPANIMLARDGAAKITDFGLIGHSGGRTSLPMGTTKYMAPEMFTGAPVDTRADIYSLGFIAYEMFVGPEKFAEVFTDVLRDERAQQVRWMHWHSNAALIPPALKDVQPGIPPLVSKIVERMTQKDPSRRFASADQIVRWLRRIFVMHVQGKSVSVSDSDALEKEMEADVTTGQAASQARPSSTVPVRPARRPAMRPAAGDAAEPPPGEVPAVEKTAPLPQEKWTPKRIAVWASAIGGPLIAVAVALLVWRHLYVEGVKERALEALRSAAVLYQARDWPAAIAEFDKVESEYREDWQPAAHKAQVFGLMARAEQALDNKQWERGDSLRNQVDQLAEPGDDKAQRWVDEFGERFSVQMEVDEQTARAETAIAAGDFLAAKRIFEDLQSRRGIDVSARISEMQERQTMKDYRDALLKARAARENLNFDAALRFAQDARDVRETTEINDLISEVMNEKKAYEYLRRAEEYVTDQRFDEAAEMFAKVYDIRPSDDILKKMNQAKAESLAAQAGSLLDSGLVDQAVAMLPKILQLNPRHQWALAKMRDLGLKKQLDGYISAADEAMRQERWPDAVESYNLALGLEAADAKTKKRLEEQLALAKLRAAVDAARDAIDQKDWTRADMEIARVRSLDPKAVELAELAESLDRNRRYFRHFDTATDLAGQGSYSAAKKEAQLAQEIDDTQEVRELMVECEYRIFLGQGKYWLGQEGGAQKAIAYLKLARDRRESIGGDLIEVNGLIKVAEGILAEGSE